jgi:hypothetical protein
MEEEPKKLDDIWRNEDGTFKKGHPPTSEGRPKGKTLKQFAADFLAGLPEEQKTKFLSILNPEIVWKMAEGQPAQGVEHSGKDGKEIIIKFDESFKDKEI